jgi:hypothetical protein
MKLDSAAQRVFDHIDVGELVKVALDLGNIDSPTGSEGPVADYVYYGRESQAGGAAA